MAYKTALVYQMKVTLIDIEPPIWRRFEVTGDRTLYQLHLILQTMMGWLNYHLYEYHIDDVEYGEPDEEYQPDIKRAKIYTLSQVIHDEKQKFLYVYDIGDYWEHEILVEKILPPNPDVYYPVWCLEGERACPPEDVGGTTGYADFLEIIHDPEHREYEHMISWSGGDFDPERFHLRCVNNELMRHGL